MQYQVNKKENIYFIIKAIVTILLLLLIVLSIPNIFAFKNTATVATVVTFALYLVIIVLFILFQKVYLIAYMKGNGINVSQNQFSEIYSLYLTMCSELGIRKIPKLFIIQEGGLLNAFAIRFSGSNYIAIYSDVFEMIEHDIDTLKFIIGHELGHVKRMHMSKRFWTILSSIVPFLTAAYSRSCEYTCDNIGFSLVNADSKRALLLLAAGKELYKQVDSDAYLSDAKINNTLSVKIMEYFMSHPYLPKRIRNIEKMDKEKV
jgi:Zn-dependent protease with chaperone function